MSKLHITHMQLCILWAVLLISACTMPLPIPIERQDMVSNPNGGDSGENGAGSSNNDLIIPVADIQSQNGLYDQREITYLDLGTCSSQAPCANTFDLTTLIRYEFVFSDGAPVIGQSPVFSQRNPEDVDTPFRRVFKVIVPFGYTANTIRSTEDLVASQFRIEPTDSVQNNPVLSSDDALQATAFNPPLQVGESWFQGKKIQFLELGTVPFSSQRNVLGVSVVYFLRNNDNTDLPSQPLPIFDSVPGDLLYSPIRQVFRAEANEQVTDLAQDPARNIRSIGDLTAALNQGLFRRVDTEIYFNFPVVQRARNEAENGGEQVAQITEMRVLSGSFFPALEAPAHYALWAFDLNNEPRLMMRFNNSGNGLVNLEGGEVSFSAFSEPLFRFSPQEKALLRRFVVTVESEESANPAVQVVLQGAYTGQRSLQLNVPFASSYAQLQNGFFMLASPTSTDQERDGTQGVWFVQRTDEESGSLPLTSNLDPGLIMSPPPEGWVYNGWLLADLRSGRWLTTGPFKRVNQGDEQALYSGSQEAYQFPGEDFLQGAPEGLSFPLNLRSSGEISLFVSLEPENISLSRPFFPLYRHDILKATSVYTNQVIEAQPVFFPKMTLHFTERSNNL